MKINLNWQISSINLFWTLYLRDTSVCKKKTQKTNNQKNPQNQQTKNQNQQNTKSKNPLKNPDSRDDIYAFSQSKQKYVCKHIN